MFLNIAAYQFIALTELPTLRTAIKSYCTSLNLRGTVILSPEGINLMLVGLPNAIREFQQYIASVLGDDELTYKESLPKDLTFNRLLVKIKEEIIAFGKSTVDPIQEKAPYLNPQELKKWLDEQRDFILLDTRNDYEVRLGTFEKAQHLSLKNFRDFPKVVAQLDESLKDKIIVTECTGGIRCEKAALYLQQQGFKHVYQLEGGILNYFAICGNAHYQGECFVFDRRVAVDAHLAETGTVQCFNCLQPVTITEQQQSNYLPEKHCANCISAEQRGVK